MDMQVCSNVFHALSSIGECGASAAHTLESGCSKLASCVHGLGDAFSALESLLGNHGTQQQGGCGMPQQQGGFGMPLTQGGSGLQQMLGGLLPQMQGGFGMPQQQGGFGMPQMQGNFGMPQMQGNFGMPQMQGNFGMPQTQGNFGMPQTQQYGSTMSQSMADRLGNQGMPFMPQTPMFCQPMPQMYGQQGPQMFGQQGPQMYGQNFAQAPQMYGQMQGPMSGQQMPMQAGAQNIPMDNPRAAREIARHFDEMAGGPGGKVNIGQLQQIASTGMMPNGQPAPPELRAACQHLANNPRALEQMETADANAQGKQCTPDGQIGKGDMNALLQRLSPAVGEQNTIAALQQHGRQMCDANGCFDKGTVQNVATTGMLPNGQSAPPELTAACKDLMSRPELFDKLDNAWKVRNGEGDQRGDGKIGMWDLNAVQNGPMKMR